MTRNFIRLLKATSQATLISLALLPMTASADERVVQNIWDCGKPALPRDHHDDKDSCDWSWRPSICGRWSIADTSSSSRSRADTHRFV